MKVLCVLNSADGGATQGILELAPFLPRNIELTLVVPSEPEPDQRVALQRHGDVVVVPMTWWNLSITLPLWYRPLPWGAGVLRTAFHARPVSTLRRLIRSGGFDLVYTGTAMTLDGALAARAAGVPHVWHIKEWIGHRARTRFPLPDALSLRVFDALSDRIVTMSDFIAGPFRAHGIDVEVIPDGADLTRFAEADGAPIREELGVPPDGVLVAMCASLRAVWKRHDVFIEAVVRAAPRLPEAKFAIFGSTPTLTTGPYSAAGRAFEALRTRASELGPALTLGRFINDIPAMMRAIDILVHPCEIEPFGRIAIEAMAAETPVIGPTSGGVAETVVDGETGVLVQPRHPSALAEAIVSLAREPSERARLGKAGRARAETLYGIERHRDAIVALFEDVLRRSR